MCDERAVIKVMELGTARGRGRRKPSSAGEPRATLPRRKITAMAAEYQMRRRSRRGFRPAVTSPTHGARSASIVAARVLIRRGRRILSRRWLPSTRELLKSQVEASLGASCRST